MVRVRFESNGKVFPEIDLPELPQIGSIILLNQLKYEVVGKHEWDISGAGIFVSIFLKSF